MSAPIIIIQGVKRIVMAAGCAFLLSGMIHAWEWSPGKDEDVMLLNDMKEGFSEMATGDFNGDGQKDIAIVVNDGSSEEIELFLGGAWPRNGLFSERKSARILTVLGTRIRRLIFSDMDGDGRDELVFSESDPQTLTILRGRISVPAVIDLSSTEPKLIISVGNSILNLTLTQGDFNGDGKKDLLVGDPSAGSGAGKVYILPGREPLPTGTVNVMSFPQVRVIMGKTGSALAFSAVGDVNLDGQLDLAVSAPGAGLNGEIYIFKSPLGLPSVIDLSSSSSVPPDTTIIGQHASSRALSCLAISEVTGDGLPDALVQIYQKHLVIDGHDLTSGRQTMDMNEGTTDFVSSLDPLPPGGGNSLVLGDFDGDGTSDVFFRGLTSHSPPQDSGKVVLSTDRGTKPFSLEPPIESSIEIRGGGHFLVADMNGDGFDDWITYNDSYPQRLSLFFGFEPLRHPTLGIDRTDGGSRRAELAFSVGGQPTEMKVGGAISDGFRDQWIPYRSALGVTCTPESGPKNINAVFRNAVGRESEPVAVTATLEVRESRVVTFTNAFRHGGRAAWDCSLPEGGPMRAWMVDGRGREVKELTNGDYPPGVATVEWDGTNAAGNPVAPGVYRLVLDVQGRKEYRVLLEP